MSVRPITLHDFPLEVLDQIACRLHPCFVHRLSLTSKTFFNHYNNPSYSFAKKNLEWNQDAIVDAIVIASADDEDDDEDNEAKPLTTILHQHMFNLGDRYLAACIVILGLRESLKLFLDLDISTLNINQQDTWFVDFTSSKTHFCKLLSIVSTSGHLDLSQYNFLVVYFLTAVVDLDTLVILEIDPSLDGNKVFMDAVEFGNVFMIETLLQDVRVQSTIDWNAAMVTAIKSGHGETQELLQHIYRKEKSNVWSIIPKLEIEHIPPFHYAFEMLTADWNDEQLSPDQNDNFMLFKTAIAAGSLRMVENIQKVISRGQTFYTLRKLFDRAVLYRYWDIVEYFIERGFLHSEAYVSCLTEVTTVNNHDMIKFVIDNCINDGYDNVWEENVEQDVLPLAAKFGDLDIVEYVLTLDPVDISSNYNKALVNAVMGNQAKVVEVLLKSGRLVDTPMSITFLQNSSNTPWDWDDDKYH
ncbi:hypothetical protein HDU76_008246, partial [Blyttiomyces sp. JEL0837]